MDPDARRFLLTGIVSGWDPRARVLHIGGQEVWVPPEVSLASLAIGKTGTAVGHEELGGRGVVSRLTVD